MKFIISFVLLLPFTFCRAQQLLREKDGKVIYEEIDSIPGVTKADLYDKSHVWFVNTFNNAKAVLQLEDKEAGQLIGKGNFTYPYKVAWQVAEWRCSFTVQIDCKDNKVRIRFYDISSRAGGEATAEYFNKNHDHSKQHIKQINDNLERFLADFKKTESTKADNNF